MNGLPLGDWQFYVVTGACLLAVWFVIRPFLPRRGGSAGCPTCASGASPKRASKMSLTVEGKRL